VREGDALRYAGRVGTGFTEAELERLAGLLGPLERETSPLDVVPKAVKIPREAIYVEPRLVCEVEFLEWSREGVLRAPSYKGLRDDKPAGLVVRERLRTGGAGTAVLAAIDGRELRLTNLDKPLWASGHTKGDLIRYLVELAPTLLPHLEHRPLTLKRYPDGADAKFFYEKQAPSHRPDWVAVAPVPLSKKIVEFCVCNDLPTLVWLANLAALELHTSMHRADAQSTPAMMVFDLDPGAPATIVECCRVALWLEGMFENLGLQAFPKTSGSKGMQVYVPLNTPGVTYADTKGFALAVAELLESSEPGLVVSRMNKDARKGKVFIDYSQNDEHKTTVCAYSLRARDRPTVSTPLEWDEVRDCLDGGDPGRLVFDARQAVERFAEQGDLFAPALSLVQAMPSLG
jgi:bifunctional non-homologous end joining protein LigD